RACDLQPNRLPNLVFREPNRIEAVRVAVAYGRCGASLFGGRRRRSRYRRTSLTLARSGFMKWQRGFTSVVLALALVAGVSCTTSDSTAPLAPSNDQAAPEFGLIGDLTGTLVSTLGSVTDLLLCSPQPYAITTETIGPSGGALKVGTHLLVIPKN